MLFSVALAAAVQSSISLAVDLRDAPRKLYHAVEIIPVAPGPLTLAYPKWLPSEHAPGAIQNQVGLVISSQGGAGQVIRWTRDPYDAYLYHLTVPQGVSAIQVRSDFITSDSGSARGGVASSELAALSWNAMLLYPYAGPQTQISAIMVTPGVTLPAGWRYATSLVPSLSPSLSLAPSSSPASAPAPASPSSALRVADSGEVTGGVVFETVSLEQLVDSPLIAGRYFREIEVAPRHYLDMVADGPEDLEVSDAQVAQLGQLVQQSGYLFRSRHYGKFRFLMTLSDNVSGLAVDHHQSLDNRRPAKFLVDPDMRARYGGFLPHDFVHSWNGKYRRPVGLMAPNFQQAVDSSGLWVYEGLTDYLGNVLTTRAGIWAQGQYLTSLAETAARYSHRPGRAWRDLQDTASMAMTLWEKGGGAYGSLRRDGFDFYGEGGLVWLDVDVTLRQRSGGRKSLDDFIAQFHGGGGDTLPQVLPYSFEDLVAALNAVTPYDWRSFLETRLHALGSDAPLGGIVGGGYRLVYRDTPAQGSGGGSGLLYSIGMEVGRGGVIADVLEDSAAQRAGLAPGMKIDKVNGKDYTTAALRQAIRDAKGARTGAKGITAATGTTGTTVNPAAAGLAGVAGVAAITLVVAGTPGAVELDYHDGERFPALERIPGTPDLLSDIIKPRTR